MVRLGPVVDWEGIARPDGSSDPRVHSVFQVLSVLMLVDHSDRQLELAFFESKGRRGMWASSLPAHRERSGTRRFPP